MMSEPDTPQRPTQRSRITTLRRAVATRVASGNHRLAALLWLTWGVGDAYSTLFAAASLGVGAEGNPLIRWTLTASPWMFLSVKLGATLAVVAAVWLTDLSRVPLAKKYLMALAAIGAIVTVTNVGVLLLPP